MMRRNSGTHVGRSPSPTASVSESWATRVCRLSVGSLESEPHRTIYLLPDRVWLPERIVVHDRHEYCPPRMHSEMLEVANVFVVKMAVVAVAMMSMAVKLMGLVVARRG